MIRKIQEDIYKEDIDPYLPAIEEFASKQLGRDGNFSENWDGFKRDKFKNIVEGTVAEFAVALYQGWDLPTLEFYEDRKSILHTKEKYDLFDENGRGYSVKNNNFILDTLEPQHYALKPGQFDLEASTLSWLQQKNQLGAPTFLTTSTKKKVIIKWFFTKKHCKDLMVHPTGDYFKNCYAILNCLLHKELKRWEDQV